MKRNHHLRQQVEGLTAYADACDELVQKLQDENMRLRNAGTQLALAAVHVAIDLEDVHGERLLAAAVKWTEAVARERRT